MDKLERAAAVPREILRSICHAQKAVPVTYEIVVE